MNIEGNSFTVDKKVRFSGSPIDESYYTLSQIFDFAYDMTFGASGSHRNHRSGGTHRRKNGQIFANAFQGKLAELVLYNRLKDSGHNPEPLDLGIHGLGIWDISDINCSKGKISVKSSKHYGNLLLLETKDWNINGQYLHSNISYDYIFLVRIKGDIEAIMKGQRLLYADTCDKNALRSIILAEIWEYDIPGFISLSDLKKLISTKQIIPQGALLNGKTVMDAENYYEESGNLKTGFWY